ncbi:FG-GAP repeat protein [Methanohalobium evestigatum Z-7303]|uniref:FG-GAP repeat protein n=1 Tax=Methanohalobium evestigatum (strain ATCC BAA-1072 / DSM 3721 / NBRC 107634 / OCM 161 / Z-7303) TaxID=644295 RepID=D7E7I5_METEZ|nr:VCBS repeat-containing protein [Methanohalobium evestigatum]ADI74058.1 FG-GAP repeat protein [Methanohalobium evestigatum Z-7303]
MMPIFLAAFLLNTGMTTAAESNSGGLQAQSNKMQTGYDVKSQASTFNTSEYAKSFPENMIRGNPEYTRSLTHADLNGDGKQDIIVTKHGVNYLYKGDGKGGFTAYKMHDKSKNTNSVSIADVNGDGIQTS